MPSIIVCDSSVLIEFSKRNILGKLFGLPVGLTMPDLLYRDELTDLGAYDRSDLRDFGLQVESLDATALEAAKSFRQTRQSLSVGDSFVLALAAAGGCGLATADRAVEQVAERHEIEVHAPLRLLDRIHGSGLLSADGLREVLEAMHNDSKCCVPKARLAALMNRKCQ